MLFRTCPRCRLVSPPEAAGCDCGFDFATGLLTAPPTPPTRPDPTGQGCHLALVGASFGTLSGGAIAFAMSGDPFGIVRTFVFLPVGLGVGCLFGGMTGWLVGVLRR